jgi:tripartite-type tricarboxylate transporter receptor subunit TctC
VVENRSGAGGNIGAEAVAKAGDPHALLIGGNGPVAINRHLYRGLTYDPDKGLVPVSLLASAPQMPWYATTCAYRGLQGIRRARKALRLAAAALRT